MHTHPQHESLFSNPIDSFTAHSYSKYNPSTGTMNGNGTSEYWNYGDSYSSTSSYSSSRHSQSIPSWSQDATMAPHIINPSSSYHRPLPGFAEISMRPERRYSAPNPHYQSDISNGMVWPSETSYSPHWTSTSLPTTYDQSPAWNETLLPHPDETKPLINSHACSPLSTISSPSPSPSPPQTITSAPSGRSSRRHSTDVTPGVKMCSHCHATSTPLWRREPTTLKPLCNACGLYLQQRNKHRPQELIDADLDDDSDTSERSGGPECSHCHTHNTSVWRRSKTGQQLCNACGVYSRLRGKDRPLSLKRNKIKPRTKHAKVAPTS